MTASPRSLVELFEAFLRADDAMMSTPSPDDDDPVEAAVASVDTENAEDNYRQARSRFLAALRAADQRLADSSKYVQDRIAQAETWRARYAQMALRAETAEKALAERLALPEASVEEVESLAWDMAREDQRYGDYVPGGMTTNVTRAALRIAADEARAKFRAALSRLGSTPAQHDVLRKYDEASANLMVDGFSEPDRATARLQFMCAANDLRALFPDNASFGAPSPSEEGAGQ